jgi:hypothetical protein
VRRGGVASSLHWRQIPGVSANEILSELPKLTEAERRAVRRKPSELAAENEGIALCGQAASEGAMEIDSVSSVKQGGKV